MGRGVFGCPLAIQPEKRHQNIMKLLNSESYNYSACAWTNRKLSMKCKWWKLFSSDGRTSIAFCQAENDLDTVHYALKDLQSMGHDVSGCQRIEQKEAEEMDDKLYVLWNIYGEAMKVILYQFSENSISATCNGETRTKKLDKTKDGFTYQMRKTKINTDGDAFKRFITDTMNPRGPFNTCCAMFSGE